MDLARHSGSDPVLLESIAKRQSISSKYLYTLLARLISAGIVRSVRGTGGGYTLRREPSEIRLDEVIRVLEGSLCVTECVEDEGICEKSEHCITRNLWQALNETIVGFISSLTLADLLRANGKKIKTLRFSSPEKRRTPEERCGRR